MQATSADISLAQLDGPLAQSASFEELKIREKKSTTPLYHPYTYCTCFLIVTTTCCWQHDHQNMCMNIFTLQAYQAVNLRVGHLRARNRFSQFLDRCCRRLVSTRMDTYALMHVFVWMIVLHMCKSVFYKITSETFLCMIVFLHCFLPFFSAALNYRIRVKIFLFEVIINVTVFELMCLSLRDSLPIM